ncbi:MAG: hypothetical protein IKJ11_07485 [Clostridia bacterium]|nr:hypothetical protein [Clostridia bacterium]
MNTELMMKRLRDHPVMREVGMEMTMGFPFYSVRANTLHVRFLLHREHFSAESAVFCKPAYRVEFVFPFRHLCRFDNLVLQDAPGAGMPAHDAQGTAFMQEYARMATQVRMHSDRLLQEAAGSGLKAETLAQYNRIVSEAIDALGLSDVYMTEAE